MKASPTSYPYRADDVLLVLAPVRRVLGLKRLVQFAVPGFTAGAVSGAIFLLIAHLWALDAARPIAVGVVVAGGTVGAILGAMRWPSPLEAARAADRRHSLHDRLTTALELRTSHTPVADMQRSDTAAHIADLSLTRGHGAWVSRRAGGAAAAAVLLFAGALFLGAPRSSTTSGTATAEVHGARIAAVQLKHLSTRLNRGLTPQQLQTPTIRKLDNALAQLQRQLARSRSEHSALRSISATQNHIQELKAGLHPLSKSAVNGLNSALHRYLPNGGAKSSASVQKQTPLMDAQELRRLAQALPHMNQSQQAAVARELEQVANAVPNTSLRASLQQAASSLARQDIASAQSALRRAANQLGQSATQQQALSRLNAANNQLNGLKNTVTSNFNREIGQNGNQQAQAGPPAAAQQGQAGAQSGNQEPAGQMQQSGSRQGSGQQPVAAGQAGNHRNGRQGQGVQGTMPGKGRSGKGMAVARGLGQGRGPGQQRGQTGQRGNRSGTTRGIAGGRGKGGKGNGAGVAGRGKSVMVYVPGHVNSGPQVVQVGPNGEPATGQLVPYQQVIGQYAQSAHEALDRSSLPPALQNEVRRYFSTISH